MQRVFHSTKLSTTPEFLLMRIERMSFDHRERHGMKNDLPFLFENVIDIKPMCTELITDQKVLYDLQQVMVHRGTGVSGHYYMHYKIVEENGRIRWFKANDHDVNEEREEILFNEALGGYHEGLSGMVNRNAFLLVYKRIQVQTEDRTEIEESFDRRRAVVMREKRLFLDLRAPFT